MNLRSKAIAQFGQVTLADSQRSEWWYDEVYRQCINADRITVVEVGVALGGSLAIAGCAMTDAARSSDKFNVTSAELIGFDKFDVPYDHTAEDEGGSDFERRLNSETNLMLRQQVPIESSHIWHQSAHSTIRSSGFQGGLTLVKGDASDTIPAFVQDREQNLQITVLRISCNWYRPVLTAMQHLVPLVQNGGSVLLDGYFFWSGFSQAVHETLGTTVASQGLRLGDCLVLPIRRGQ